MRSDTYIPRRLDDQWKLGFGDADVAFPFVFFLFLGWMSGTEVGLRALRRRRLLPQPVDLAHQGRQAPGLRDALGVLGLAHQPATAMRATPPSHIRRMVG